MSQAGVALRPTVLAKELERRGLGHEVADQFAWHLTARHPFARRLGVEVLSREIARRGLDENAAHDTALMLLALELLDGGLHFGRVVQELRRWEGPGHSAWAEAMEAMRLARSLAKPPRPDPSTVGDRLAIAFLGLGIIALLACLLVVA
jgi:hypothetical protein